MWMDSFFSSRSTVEIAQPIDLFRSSRTNINYGILEVMIFFSWFDVKDFYFSKEGNGYVPFTVMMILGDNIYEFPWCLSMFVNFLI